MGVLPFVPPILVLVTTQRLREHPFGSQLNSEPLCFTTDKVINIRLCTRQVQTAQLNTYYKYYNPKKPQDRSYFNPDVHA